MDRSLIKNQAKEALKGKWIMYFVILAIVGVISGFTAGILAPVLAFGVYLITLDILNGVDIDANRFGDTFKDINHLLKLIGVAFLSAIIIAVGYFLFIIPGIILSYMLAQASYIMMENPEIGVIDAMKRSSEMMKGYKLDLFIFKLSYIGHFLLVMITFGIYAIYFTPLYTVAHVNYYKHLKDVRELDVIDAEVVS